MPCSVRAIPVVVGIDPRWEQLPGDLRPAANSDWHVKAAAIGSFSKAVIDVVSPLVPAVKVQAAFFEELGPAGMPAMGDVIEYAQAAGLLVILDGKRNDIGNTAAAYARAYLGRDSSPWRADALTVSPYLGDDSLTPFVDVARERGAGVFVLVKTSNPGGRMLQDVQSDGRTDLPASCRTRRAMCPPIGWSTWVTAASGRSSARRIRSNWRSCGR